MTVGTANRRALVLLALGSVIGMCLGAASGLRDTAVISQALQNGLPKDAIAIVNDAVISSEEYHRAVAMLASDKRNALTDADRVHVLNRLIEEELLIQAAMRQGFVETDRSVRQAMTQAMLASIVTDSASKRPTEEELRAFYQQNIALFEQNAIQGATQDLTTRVPSFEEIHNQIEELYLQQAKDTALREYLAWLHDEAEIVLGEGERLH